MSAKDGKPCVKCGSTERYKDGRCASCERERARQRYCHHPEKRKAANREWNHRNAEKIKAYDRRREENSEKERERIQTGFGLGRWIKKLFG